MSTYGRRLLSFSSKWPHVSPSPKDLAEAGFSYCPTSELPDNVFCRRCNTQLCDWEPADDPLQEHYRRSKRCIRLATADSPMMFVQDVVVLPPKHSQASSKDLQASPQKASLQKASTQSLPPLLAESSSSSKILTYDERLASFTSVWPHASPKPQDLARAGLSYMPTKEHPDQVTCKRCNAELVNWLPADDPILEHYRCSKTYIRLARPGATRSYFVPDAMAPLAKDSQASTLKNQKGSSLQAPSQIAPQKAPLPSTKDIEFLDPSLQHNFPNLCLFHNTHAFYNRIERGRSAFSKADILALLPKCLRGEALRWFNQSEYQDLALCIEALKARFSQQASSQQAPQSSQATPQEISQIACQALEYHHCKLCNASFSSMARLIRHTQENICDKPSCRHCETVFSSKNQLHIHLREECRKQTHRSLPSPSSKSSSKSSSRSSSRSSSTWPSTCPSHSSTACPSTCSPKSSPAPSPAPSPPPRYRAISPPPSTYGICLTVADLYTRYARPPYLNIHDLFRMFGRRSARSSTTPTSARSAGVPTAPSTPAASKHPPIRHRGRCQAKRGDGSTKPPKQLTKHLTKQQQNQKQKINFVRTSLQLVPCKTVLPLQRSRSMSCPIAAFGSPSFHTRVPPQSSTPQCIRS